MNIDKFYSDELLELGKNKIYSDEEELINDEYETITKFYDEEEI